MAAPSTSSRELVSAPIRRDCPAAKIDRGDARDPGRCVRRARFAQLAARGISLSNPPTPIAWMAGASTGTPASNRHNTQSTPLSLGDRAQPGRPITGVSPTWAVKIRLPGSTGIRNDQSCRPPRRCRTAPRRAGRRSPTRRRSRSAHSPRQSARHRRTNGVASWASAARRSRRCPSWVRRCADHGGGLIQHAVLGARQASSSPDPRCRGVIGAKRPGASCAIADAGVDASRGAANGMIFTVASNWPSVTWSNGVSVAIGDGFMDLVEAIDQPRDPPAPPRRAGKQVAPPGKGALVLAPVAANGPATAAAASSSGTSPSSNAPPKPWRRRRRSAPRYRPRDNCGPF